MTEEIIKAMIVSLKARRDSLRGWTHPDEVELDATRAQIEALEELVAQKYFRPAEVKDDGGE